MNVKALLSGQNSREALCKCSSFTTALFTIILDTCFLISDPFSLPFQEDGLSPREQELKDLKESLQDTQPVGVLVDGCRTMDQVRGSSNKHFGVHES